MTGDVDDREPMLCSWTAPTTLNRCTTPRVEDVEAGVPGSGRYYAGGYCHRASHKRQVLDAAREASQFATLRITEARKTQPIKVGDRQLRLI